MKASGKRLAKAIEKRGWESRAAFARAVGQKEVTVRQQINRGGVPASLAPGYSRTLKVPVTWLLFGAGPDPFFGPRDVKADAPESAVNDSLASAEGDLVPQETEALLKEGGHVTMYTFIRIVGDLENKIGRLEEEIRQLRDLLMADGSRAHPRKGRARS